MDDQLKSLYIDLPSWRDPVQVDDFLVAIGKKQSNSVYHVAEVRPPIPKHNGKMNRYHMKVYKSDLVTALKRDDDQQLITLYWYPRGK